MRGLRGDITDKTKKIMNRFEKNKGTVFTAKELEKICKIDAKTVRNILAKLLRRNKVVRISRGKYRYPKPEMTLSKEQIARYITTLEKTCEIAIYDLMLAEAFVGKDDMAEIEHQIAYFARYLVKVRWESEHGGSDFVDVDDTMFKRAKKIHAWSKFVFERSRTKKK